MIDLLEGWRLTLKALLLPPGSLLLIITIGLLLYRRLAGRLLAWSGLACLYLLSIPAVSDRLAPMVETIPPANPQQLLAQGAQAILVLGAGQSHFNPELDGQARLGPMSLQRLDYALQLHRATGLPLIISGGSLESYEEPLAVLAARWLSATADLEPLALETRSRTTWENLALSSPILGRLDIHKVALVTHAYHMPRAMQAARRHSVDAIPAGFAYIHKHTPPEAQPDDLRKYRPSAHDLAVNYLLLHELAGRLWYRLKE